MGSAWPTGAYATSTSPSVFDLLPQLSADEKARFPSLGPAPERQAVTTFSPPKPIGPPIGYAPSPLLPISVIAILINLVYAMIELMP